jgi:hypothetical protein
MKRRHFVRALVAAPAAPVLLAQQTSGGGAVPAQPVQGAARAAEESPKIEVATPDATAEPLQRFFTQPQFAALRRLCDIFMPPGDKVPGALGAGVPAFLDFLIGESPAERQQVYRTGLDALNAAAKKKYARGFADVDASQVDPLLAPLHAAWTYEEPSDPLARFLRAAKIDVRTATMNSREYSAVSSNSGRRGGGNALYWYPLD